MNGGNNLKKNGFMDVDLLDLNILYATMNDEKTRGDIKKEMDISKEKARLRLERLVDSGVLDKKEICMGCGNILSECECGKYKKIIYYTRNSSKEEVVEMKDFIDSVEKISEHITIQDVEV